MLTYHEYAEPTIHSTFFLDNGKENVPAFCFQEASSYLLQCFVKQLYRMKKMTKSLDDETLIINHIAKSLSVLDINLHDHRL